MAERRESEEKDLKQREYRDKEGEIHHHTHEYMERKGGEKGREGEREREGERKER